MKNIPIYRAKRIDNDEDVEGFYLENAIGKHIIVEVDKYNYELWTEIDPTTLAIHFSDMLDSKGNKIFASLSEDGKGGDIVDSEDYPFMSDGQKNYNAVVSMIFNQPQYVYNKISENVRGASHGINKSFDENYSLFRVIGIQK